MGFIKRVRVGVGVGVEITIAAAIAYAGCQLPALGAGGLLHPARRHTSLKTPDSCEDVMFDGAGVALKGWQCRTAGTRLGTVIYLHGIADNRTSGAGVVERFVNRGFDVIAYDSRAHGESCEGLAHSRDRCGRNVFGLTHRRGRARTVRLY
jgi:pimeloyl-ACP methyl ester carboxylesterase